MLNRFCFCVMLLFSFFSAYALELKPAVIGNILFKNATLQDPTPSGEFTTLVIPIRRAQNLIVIEAQVDSLQGNFILDTGAPYLVLNQTYFRDYPKYKEQEAGGVNGDAGNSFQTKISHLNITELSYDKLQADVTDLSGIENSRGIKVLGLLGTRLFSNFAITIDLFQNVLYIHKLDKSGNIPEKEVIYREPYLKMPFYFANNAIFLKGSVNDHQLWFAFDTGAETNLIDYHQTKNLMEYMHIINRSKLTGVGGSSYEVIYAKFDKLVLGDRTFMYNHVLITNLEKMGKAYGHDVDGILGSDFFSRGVFCINFVKKEFEMYINKN
jgi:hypothetical protein